jgi:hypothetical protein
MSQLADPSNVLKIERGRMQDLSLRTGYHMSRGGAVTSTHTSDAHTQAVAGRRSVGLLVNLQVGEGWSGAPRVGVQPRVCHVFGLLPQCHGD